LDSGTQKCNNKHQQQQRQQTQQQQIKKFSICIS